MNVYVEDFVWHHGCIHIRIALVQLPSFIIFEWYLLHSVDCISVLETFVHMRMISCHAFAISNSQFENENSAQ